MSLNAADLATQIPDGSTIIVPPSRSGPAMSVTLALITRRAKDLHLIAMPTSGIQADILIGAGCVATVESAGVTLDEFGQAPRFVAAVKAGEIELMDTTCPALISAVQAGEKGIPFIPMRGLIGSDLMAHRPDYKVIENPMQAGDMIVALPAIRPDVALFHSPLADAFGNVWIGKSRELMTMAHASFKTLVTVEKIVDFNLMADQKYAPACIPAHYISGLAVAKNGSWPIGLEGVYATDEDAVVQYAKAAQTTSGFDAFVAELLSSVAAE